MSYFLLDANGFVRDFASIGGLERLAQWAGRSNNPVVQGFFNTGMTDYPEQLAHNLSLARNTITENLTDEMVSALIETCKTCAKPLIISDGTDGADEEAGVKILVGNGSNQYVSKGAATAKVDKQPALSHGDSNFRAVPFTQGSDKNVSELEKKEIGQPVTRDYNPAQSMPLATQDYIEADKVKSIIEHGPLGGKNGGGGSSIKVVNFRGRDYIIDGHHRLAAALFEGKSVKVHYYGKVK